MEVYYREKLDEDAGLIGYHFEQAGEHLKAARCNARAAAWLGTTNPSHSITHWRKVRHLLEGVSRTAEVDRLRVTAGGKIALLGWREGMTLQEVKPLIDDALALANEGDDRLVPWLLTIEGRMLVASGGPADGYVDLVKKALLYIDVDRDPGRVCVANAFLSQAYAWAGSLREALAANDVALANAAHVDAFDKEFIGFSIEQWILGVRVRLLVRMARVEEARECLDRMLELELVSTEPPVPGMARFGFIDLACVLNDAPLADRHAEELARANEKHGGTPYVEVFFHGYRGFAAAVGGNHREASVRFRYALELVRAKGAAREYEPELLTGLAEANLQSGNASTAYEQACLAVEMAKERTTRLAECRARIIRALAMLELHGPSAQEEAYKDLDEAEKLVATTGALALGRIVNDARSRILSVRAT
jgi:adenylate cyclase